MEKICSEEEFAGYAHSKGFRSLGVGCMSQEAVERMPSTIHRNGQPRAVGDNQRMFLFARLGSTIAGTLASLGAIKDLDWFRPQYTAYIAMELFLGSWFVRLNYQGKPVVLPRCAEKGSYLRGCKGVYTFKPLRDLVNEFERSVLQTIPLECSFKA
ncbi:hypothetical protein LX32DRAFT_656364 [Colletotrichum zoysiae]|uniref:Uncharacterized protein n=1 Tax=Colletotrichum zoysiae TaxID=1216348 RepID=A0AAD9HA76_9PEZI|nr:hypothetical protein LX32DRAFT_656364 [Colletotrichum zoysiae]